MQLKETIFDELSVIWIEKLHSQMIVWLFNSLIEWNKTEEINLLINGFFLIWLKFRTKTCN